MADMTLDLNGYFERIGYHGAAAPTFDVLHDPNDSFREP
jgi:arylamine N-acetyltransferase